MQERVTIRAVVFTASDSRTIEDDVSGSRAKMLLESIGAEVVEHKVISDDLDAITAELIALSDRPDINLIITTGGTGLGPRDNTPEATLKVIEREVSGIPEAMRRETSAQTPTAILSRAVAGSRKKTLIINLPGSPKGVAECFQAISPILPHAIRMLTGDTEH
jgi:molybdopterin adenylyltransferase